MPTRWLYRLAERTEATQQVLIFCHAGASVTSLRACLSVIPPTIEPWAMELAGRGYRIVEPLNAGVPHLIDGVIAEVLQRMDRTVLLLGHSLGARVALAVGRALQDRGMRPTALCVVACAPPHVDSKPHKHTMSDADLIEVLRSVAGTPAAVLANEELLSLFLPILRSDFEMFERTDFVSGEVLDCPVVAIAASNDELATTEVMSQWARYTRDRFALREVKGGHFFPVQSPSKLWATLVSELGRINPVDS